MNTSEQTSVILLAHGSRDTHWLAPFEELLETVQQAQPNTSVALAYLELAAPNLPDTLAHLYEQGSRTFDILPLFFAAGRHLRHDLPQLLEQLMQHYFLEKDAIQINLHPPIGQDPSIRQAIAHLVQTKLDIPPQKLNHN